MNQSHTNQHRVVLALILAILTTLALGVTYKVASWDVASQAIGNQNSILVSIVKLRQNFSLYGFPWQICGILIWIIYFKKIDCFRSTSLLEAAVAFLFGTINVISNSLAVNGNWDFVFANTYQLIISLVCIIGQGAIFILIFKSIFNFLDLISAQKQITLPDRKRFFKLFEKYPWRFSFIALMLFWALDLVIAYPAQITYDGVNQIMQWIGMIPITDHHPVVSTWIIGTLYDIGGLFGNDNFTIFFIVLCISFIMAACYATVVWKIQQMGISYISEFTLLFYGLHPMMGEYAHTIIKDSISVAIFILFVLEVASFALDYKKYFNKRRNLFSLTIWSFLSCAFRHNYIYAVFPTLAVMFFVTLCKEKIYIKSMTICIAGCMFLTQGLHFFSKNVLNYPSGSIREALSIPFQQTARYVRDHADEITIEEKMAISAVLDYDSLGKKYNPNTSDPVKATYHGDSRALKEYFRIWRNMLLKHPETYIQSAIHSSHGYYAFVSIEQTDVRTIHDVLRYNSSYKYYVDQLQMDLSHPIGLEQILITWENIKEIEIRFPVVGLLSNCATYTWLFIIIGFYFIRKREWRIMEIMFPLFIIFLTCIMSPVNGNWRYFFPIVVSTPIIIAASIKILINREITK